MDTTTEEDRAEVYVNIQAVVHRDELTNGNIVGG